MITINLKMNIIMKITRQEAKKMMMMMKMMKMMIMIMIMII